MNFLSDMKEIKPVPKYFLLSNIIPGLAQKSKLLLCILLWLEAYKDNAHVLWLTKSSYLLTVSTLIYIFRS